MTLVQMTQRRLLGCGNNCGRPQPPHRRWVRPQARSGRCCPGGGTRASRRSRKVIYTAKMTSSTTCTARTGTTRVLWLDAQGKPVAWQHRAPGSSIMARWAPPLFQNGLDPDTIDWRSEPPYAIPHMLVDYVRHEPRGSGQRFGVASDHAQVFVVESLSTNSRRTAKERPGRISPSPAHRESARKGGPRSSGLESGWGSALPSGTGRGTPCNLPSGPISRWLRKSSVAAWRSPCQQVVCALDCGTAVNPDSIRAQMQSGIVLGSPLP